MSFDVIRWAKREVRSRRENLMIVLLAHVGDSPKINLISQMKIKSLPSQGITHTRIENSIVIIVIECLQN
jgi:hypothetical protein